MGAARGPLAMTRTVVFFTLFFFTIISHKDTSETLWNLPRAVFDARKLSILFHQAQQQLATLGHNRRRELVEGHQAPHM